MKKEIDQLITSVNYVIANASDGAGDDTSVRVIPSDLYHDMIHSMCQYNRARAKRIRRYGFRSTHAVRN